MATQGPPALTFAFFGFPSPNFFFRLKKSQVCRGSCPQGQKRRSVGGKLASVVVVQVVKCYNMFVSKTNSTVSMTMQQQTAVFFGFTSFMPAVTPRTY
jgi:hypothetical protein